jgi:hypothetical protein
MTVLPQALFSYYDDSFSIHLSRTYDLSVYVERDLFSFCFTRHDDNCLIGIESYKFSVSDPNTSAYSDAREWCRELAILLESQDALKKHYHTLRIAVECNKSTLIPREIYSEETQTEFLKFNHQLEDFECCRHDYLPQVGAELVYGIPLCIIETLQENFPESEISGIPARMIENLLKLSQETTGDGKLCANVRASWVDILCIEKGKLRYFNCFRYRTREDLAYYIIFVMEQLGLNPDTINLMLMGNIERESERFELLYKYIRNIRLLDKSIKKRGKMMETGFSVSNYYNLLSFAKCV